MTNLSNAIALKLREHMVHNPIIAGIDAEQRTLIGALSTTSAARQGTFTLHVTQQGGAEQSYDVVVRPKRSPQ